MHKACDNVKFEKGMSVAEHELTIDVIGEFSPDPLRFGFVKKTSAHIAGHSQAVTNDEQQSIMTTLLNQQEVAPTRCLYVHIPFCRVRCTYCNFFQYASSKQLVDDYFSALLVELKQKALQPWTQSAPFQAVYIGGGTPTDLNASQIKRLGKMIREYFPLATDCELTLEGRINRFSDELFESALEGGFNRFSFGVQSFNTQVRRKAKRLDDRDVVLSKIERLAAYDQAPIVIDLLYGLPYQDLDTWQQDLIDFFDTDAHGVDLYQLVEMGGTPMADLVEKGRLPQPANTAIKASMFELGVAEMDAHFMKRLSVNHWANDNRERSLYNSLAKTTAEVLPLGAGAGGNIDGYSFMQHRTLDKYFADIEKGVAPTAIMMKQATNTATIMAIKSAFDRGVVSDKALEQQAGWDVFTYCQPLFKAWQQHGFVELNRAGGYHYLSLTLAGQFWAVTLAQAMIKIVNKVNITSMQAA